MHKPREFWIYQAALTSRWYVTGKEPSGYRREDAILVREVLNDQSYEAFRKETDELITKLQSEVDRLEKLILEKASVDGLRPL